MKAQLNTFIIVREDQAVDPVTLVTEGLSIGRLPNCELVLNHPTVSRLHAGIREVEGHFYITHLSPSNSTTLNGRLVEEREALTDGDIVQIGPFFLHIGHDGEALTIRVVYQTAVRIGDAAIQPGAPEPPGSMQAVAAARKREPTKEASAVDDYWRKRQREAGKITRPSGLRPRTPPRLGKARFNWTPTRDLVRPWPFAIFTWAVVVVAVLTLAAAFGLTNAFSPAPLSNPHTRTALALQPAVAKQPNGNTCTSCHAVKASMNDACASCHQTQAFAATTTAEHKAAGINCINCHTEHKGADFRPALQPVNASFQHPGIEPTETCAGCHNDANKQTYNGKSVHTPHGGTFGYPVSGGQWVWEGLTEEERATKAEDFRRRMANFNRNWQGLSANQLRNTEFHALHDERLRAVGGLPANSDGSVSCSTCHKTFVGNIDRETPRTTCGVCHNGAVDAVTNQQVIAADKPNCNSCHIQHVGDRRLWNPTLYMRQQQAADVAPAHAAGLLASLFR